MLLKPKISIIVPPREKVLYQFLKKVDIFPKAPKVKFPNPPTCSLTLLHYLGFIQLCHPHFIMAFWFRNKPQLVVPLKPRSLGSSTFCLTI